MNLFHKGCVWSLFQGERVITIFHSLKPYSCMAWDWSSNNGTYYYSSLKLMTPELIGVIDHKSFVLLRICLLSLFKQQFLVFKHYTYFRTLFHLHVFLKNTNNDTSTTLEHQQWASQMPNCKVYLAFGPKLLQQLDSYIWDRPKFFGIVLQCDLTYEIAL